MKKVLWALWVPMSLLLWSGCLKEEERLSPEKPGVQPKDTVWTLSIQAVREDGPDTKGLSIGEGDAEATTQQLRSIWKADEPVLVYLGSDCIGTLKATPDASDAHRATLSGTVTASGITPGVTRLSLLTPRQEWDYTGQVGRLLLQDDPNNTGASNRSIENRFHYTKADEVLVTAVSAGDALATEPASFVNQQSIYRLSFRFQKDGAGDKYAIVARQVRISAAGGGLVQTISPDGTSVTGPIDVVLDNATENPFFVALRNQNTTESEALNFQVIDQEGVTYYGSKTIPAQYKPNGKFVSAKNATLTGRLDLSLGNETVSEAL